MNGMFGPIDVANYIQQQGEIGRERGQRSYLGKLYGQAATAAPEQRSELYALMGKTDPEFARGAENHFAQRDAAQQERMATELRNRASILRQLPPEQRAIGWQRMAPDVAKLTGMPELAQMPYDPATFDPVLDQIAGIGASEPKVLSPGSAMYDSSGRLIAQNEYQAPTAAQIVAVPDGNGGTVSMVWDGRTRQLSDLPVAGVPAGAPQAAPDPSTYADVQGTLDAIGQKYGFETTSTIRTPAENKAARGVPNSQHLTGTARDFSIRGKSPEQIAAMRAELESAGFEVLVSDHGTGPHMHAELPPGGRGQMTRVGYNPPKEKAPSELERRIEMARSMGASDEEVRRMVVGGDNARDAQRISTADATKARIKLTQIRAARQQLRQVRDAFGKIENTFSAGVGGNFLPTPEGQAFDKAVSNFNPLITAVTRVPGVGAMSDYESRLQTAGLPSRGTYEGTTAQQIADTEALLNTLEQGYLDLLGEAPQAQEASDDDDALIQQYLR
jgi:hypothetical protein